MNIRRLTIEDVDGLLRFYQTLSEDVAYFYHPFKVTEENVRWHLNNTDSGEFISLAVESPEGEILGHAFIANIRSEKPIFGIGLSDRLIGQGWGKRLMQEIMDEARELQIPKVCLTVYKDNPRAKSLYEKMGFVTTGETGDERKSYCMEYIFR